MAETKDKNLGFTDKEKLAFADDILPLFLNKNFGTVQKTEVELMVFHHYLKHCESLNKSVSDLSIGKQLGITPARVRNMKLKDYLHQDDDSSWKQKLLNQMNETSFEIKGKDILFVVCDVTLMTELRSFLEENGFVNEYSLNPNLFSCSVDVMLKIWAILSGKEADIVSKSLMDFLEEKDKELKINKDSKILEIFDLINPELCAILPKAMPAINIIKKLWHYYRK